MNIQCKILIIIAVEVGLTIIYTFISPKSSKNQFIDYRSILKGLVERAFITYSLISGFPHALTLFGALKLGTRLKHPDEEKTEEGRKQESLFNDYYILGNFISVSIGIFYFNLLS